jgi:PAS domain S-box-containing protein
MDPKFSSLKVSEFVSPVIPSEIPREPPLPSLPPEQEREHLDTQVRDKLPPLLLALGGFYLLYTAYLFVIQPAPAVLSMALQPGIVALLMAGAGLALRKWQLPPLWAHPAGLLMGGLVCVNTLAHYVLTSDPLQTCALMILVVGFSCLFTNFNWYLVLVAMTVLVFGIGALGKTMEWVYFGFGLGASILLGFTLNREHISRGKQLANLVFSLADRRRNLGEFAARLLAAEERTSRLSKATFEGILFHEAGHIVDCNATALNLFGYSTEEIRGREVLSLVSPDSRDAVSSLIRFGTVTSNLAIGLRKNKTEFPIEIFNKSVEMQGSPLQVIVIRDVSGQREIQLSLAREKKDLEDQYVRLKSLTAIDVMVDEMDDLRQVFDRITQTAAEMLPASSGSCLLFRRGDSSELRLGSIFPPNPSLPANVPVPVMVNSSNAWILENMEPLVIPSVNEDHMNVRDTFPGLPIQACVAVPLQSDGRLVGILYAFDKFTRHYRKEDLEFIQALGNRASIVWVKFQLFHQLRTANQNLQSQQTDWQRAVEEKESARTQAEESNRNLRYKQEQLQETIIELEAAKASAEDANRAKSEFLSTVSHELRTPLNGVLGMAEILQTETLPFTAQSAVHMLRESALRLQHVIERILSFAEIRDQRVSLAREPFNPFELVQAVAAEFRPQATAKNLDLTSGPSHFAAAAGPCWGDPDKIRKVLAEFLENSLKFTQEGSIRMEVIPVTDQAGRRALRFTVTDSGVGVRPGSGDKIFNAFTQADGSHSRKYEGTGLGLALAKQYVLLMRGKIGYDSPDEGGAIFWFELPLDLQEKTEPALARTIPAPKLVSGGGALAKLPGKAPAASPAAVAPAAGLAKNSRVMVVDQDRAHQALVMDCLKNLGLRGTAVSSNYEVMSALKRQMVLYDPFQVVLLDASVSLDEAMILAETIHANQELASVQLLVMVRPDQTVNATDIKQAGIHECLLRPVTGDALAGAFKLNGGS